MNHVGPIRDPYDITLLKNYLRQWSERNYILFLFGINTGLRISDIIKVKVEDIHDGYIYIREKKTRKARQILITTTLKRDLDPFIKNKEGFEYVFRSRKGRNQPITRQTAYAIIKQAAKECEIPDVGTHSLRKTYGYHHYKEFNNIALLMDEFNHSSPDITLRYIGIQQDNRDQAMAKFGL